MKPIFIFLFLQLFVFNSEAQITHVTFNPFINVCSDDNAGPIQTGTYVIDTTIFMDIDSNGINDLYFDLRTKEVGAHFHYQSGMISVIPLNSNEIAVTSQNQTLAEAYDSADYAATGFTWSRDSSFLCYYYRDGLQHLDTAVGRWNYVIDKNLSFRLINAQDTIIAFIKMDCFLDTIIVNSCIALKSYEFNGTLISTPELPADEFLKVFPIPTMGHIQIITDDKIENVDVFSLDGKMIMSGIKSKSFELGNDNNFQGPLLLKITLQNSVIYKKIILY